MADLSQEDLAEIAEMFSALDGRDRLDEALVERAEYLARQRQEDRKLGAGRVLHRRRVSLPERLPELEAKARGHFAGQKAQPKPGRPRLYTPDEMRDRLRVYWREYSKKRREETRRAVAAIRAKQEQPTIDPVGRSTMLRDRLAAALAGISKFHDDRRAGRGRFNPGPVVWRPGERCFEAVSADGIVVAEVYWSRGLWNAAFPGTASRPFVRGCATPVDAQRAAEARLAKCAAEAARSK